MGYGMHVEVRGLLCPLGSVHPHLGPGDPTPAARLGQQGLHLLRYLAGVC